VKKITKPAEKEEAVYYSDFSGKCFGEFNAPVQLKIEFNYGSIYDGSKFTFDLDDNDIADVLFLLKGKLSNETKKDLKQRFVALNDRYDQNVQNRDWTECDYICNEKHLLNRLI
jgi:hypothetical protein